MEEEKDLNILSEKEIRERLNSFSGWIFIDNKITKTFLFSSFNDALAIINELAPFCNNIDHHPDIHIYYKKVVFDLRRFSVGGKVTERDFTVAKKIDDLYFSRDIK
ncbi:hypothetical protein A2316_02350 [Candidatus Falkowbacteria bacterium RIFOXYB2_FULL_38_15]|uniref:4a-hydroxytetrahydrobiopterin dehydratase n=1 Tax=Candidatus Falkowbacteria bacterium RIFOXYA2_FULL_38_12 TaxID=1797993 RepID=A0A1F5S416_9BACT|nr:MAG: hypothetical protein A2257_00595 [Candidatus Falkowbacteria bacterium RIFOXYA2_FULL_38_12]OGF33032.1 MAG: hypothetical protein A2316_02350 [Candidatus Falkowbacteria bacterium RIFOXYB2_FULL_38_15]OGF44556.1 MAG: hypothetical protein A2555_00735 [Candidatus Falkowbacteria bacterium RIFOXYD2_FULL_39_16]